MRSQHIPGEGIENVQNYIEERMIDASNTGELADQNEALRDHVQDLQGISGQASQSTPAEASDETLKATATTPTTEQELASQARTNASVGPVDPEQLPPTSEARSRVVSGTGGGEMGS